MQAVSELQKSKSSLNSYFDVNFQISEKEVQLIRVMSSKAEKRKLFLDKLAAEQPVMLSNIQMSPSGTTVFNYGTMINDVPAHTVKFKFCIGKQNITKVKSLLQDYTSGFFTVSGLVHLI